MKGAFNKQIGIGIGSIVATIVIATGALYYLIGDIQSRADQIVRYRSTMAMEDANLSNAAELKGDQVQAAKYKAAMDQLLPSQDDLISFPQMIDTIARSYNVDDQVSFTGSTNAPTETSAGSVGFSIEVDGQSADCIAFLKNIESKSNQFIVNITNFDFFQNDPQSKLVAQGNVFFQ